MTTLPADVLLRCRVCGLWQRSFTGPGICTDCTEKHRLIHSRAARHRYRLATNDHWRRWMLRRDLPAGMTPSDLAAILELRETIARVAK